MISFALDEDQTLVQDTVRSFARDVVRPHLRAWERAGAVPDDARRRFHELGLAFLDLPEAVGGGGSTALTAALAHEELAFGDAGAAVALWAPSLAADAVVELGSEAQARDLVGHLAATHDALGAVAWSERDPSPVAGFATRALRDGDAWLLQGNKCFVVHGGIAARTVVFAQVEPDRGWDGIGAFVVDKCAAGARHGTLGLETAHIGSIVLDGVRVPESLRLEVTPTGLRRFLARATLVAAARQVGLARASYEYALAYTQDRQAFGKPVAHFQAIAFTLADMHMDVESARWMLWRAAVAFDKAHDDAALHKALPLVAEAGVHANEAAWRVADNGVQLLGGAGYIQDHPVEKWLRDTKTLAMMAPTSELGQLTVAASELGAHFDVLPSTAMQPIVT